MWRTSYKALGKAIYIYLFISVIHLFFFIFFLLTGKTERGSYSSYGRDSNLQGCHQVSEILLSRGVVLNTLINEVCCLKLYILGAGSVVNGDGCRCAFLRKGLYLQMQVFKLLPELFWPGCSSWRLRALGLT